MQAKRYPQKRWAGIVACLCLAGVIVAGCDNKRTLSWYYTDKAPKELAPPCKVAIATEVSPVPDMPLGNTGREELVNGMVGELVARGYRVTILREKALSGVMPGIHFEESATAKAGKTPVAKIEKKGTSSQPADQMILRYKSAAKVHAKILAEVSMQTSSEMKMRTIIVPIPFFPDSTSTEWITRIRQATIRLSKSQDGTTLGAVTVRYSRPCDKIMDVVKDLACGLDMILQSRPPGSVEMLGPPGKIKKAK